MLTLYIKGKGEIKLSQNQFISQGGQGQIFGQGDTAFKIYLDSSKMIPLAKIQELAALDDPLIFRPLDVLYNKKDEPVGYTMRRIVDRYPLPRLFTKSFRQAQRISPDTIYTLICKMGRRLDYIHSKKILVVDYNEMNFAALPDFSDTCNFDVDSYQTRSFPANALMESVRDRHSTKFSELTDWFSFGVVTFQLFIGIHPYKGKHPVVLYPDAAATMDERMKRNISVLNKDVKIPAVCYAFDVIPPSWREWYFKLFEKGERLPPPLDSKASIRVVQVAQTMATGKKVKITERFTADAEILKVAYLAGCEVILTGKSIYVNKRGREFTVKGAEIGFTPKGNHPIVAYLEGNHVKLYDAVANEHLRFAGEAADIVSSNSRLYLLSGTNILEVQFLEVGNDIIPSVQLVSTFIPQASQVFDGVIIQDLLGTYFAYFFPNPKTCQQVPLPELSGFTVIDARYEGRVLMVVGAAKGKYNRFIFRFDTTSPNDYDCRVMKDVPYVGLNFTVLDNGVCASFNEDDSLEIFRTKITDSQITYVTDDALDYGMKLWHDGTTALLSRENKVYNVKMA